MGKRKMGRYRAVKRKRSKAQGVGGKPTNVKTFAAKHGGTLLVASCYD